MTKRRWARAWARRTLEHCPAEYSERREKSPAPSCCLLAGSNQNADNRSRLQAGGQLIDARGPGKFDGTQADVFTFKRQGQYKALQPIIVVVKVIGRMMDISYVSDDPSPEELTILLFQSVRELLFNVVKHAGVREARVEVAQLRGRIRVEVSDKGVGFNPNQLRADRSWTPYVPAAPDKSAHNSDLPFRVRSTTPPQAPNRSSSVLAQPWCM